MSKDLKNLRCGRCLAYFPAVPIIQCGDLLSLCPPCHYRVHPKCTKLRRKIEQNEAVCQICDFRNAVVLCPVCCDDSDEGRSTVAMCRACSHEVHLEGTSFHMDHVTILKERPSEEGQDVGSDQIKID